ncbi:hypothetical protein RZS08_42675, partial [Arthrospira platensis SPKY1]|nr:hypothetical protein [Arthrospira platensis SPKY1]
KVALCVPLQRPPASSLAVQAQLVTQHRHARQHHVPPPLAVLAHVIVQVRQHPIHQPGLVPLLDQAPGDVKRFTLVTPIPPSPDRQPQWVALPCGPAGPDDV